MNFSSREDDHAILIYAGTDHRYTRHVPADVSAYAAVRSGDGENLYGVWSAGLCGVLPGKAIKIRSSRRPRNTITDFTSTYDELAQIRETSMAMDRENNWAFLYCCTRFRYSPSSALRHFYFTVDVTAKTDGEKNLLKTAAA